MNKEELKGKSIEVLLCLVNQVKDEDDNMKFRDATLLLAAVILQWSRLLKENESDKNVKIHIESLKLLVDGLLEDIEKENLK